MQNLKLILVLTIFVILESTVVSGKRARDDDDDSSGSSSSTESLVPVPIRQTYTDRPKRYDGSLPSNDPVSSSQNLNPQIAGLGGLGGNLGGLGGNLGGIGGLNYPYSLNNQASLLNNPALSVYQNGGLGLGNQGIGGLGGLGGLNQGINPYLGGGLNNFQNPYASLQSQLLLQQAGGQGGLYNGAAGLDPYSQQQGGGIYNSFLGLNNGGIGSLGAAGGGINPYLLGGRAGQYLGGNYLAQSLLSPYNSFSQLNPYNSYPFSSRFGVGRASTRINNPSSSSSSSNNDE